MTISIAVWLASMQFVSVGDTPVTKISVGDQLVWAAFTPTAPTAFTTAGAFKPRSHSTARPTHLAHTGWAVRAALVAFYRAAAAALGSLARLGSTHARGTGRPCH